MIEPWLVLKFFGLGMMTAVLSFYAVAVYVYIDANPQITASGSGRGSG
jgi:hypothetical protein